MTAKHTFLEWFRQNSSFVEAISTAVSSLVLVLAFIGNAVKTVVNSVRAVVRFFGGRPKQVQEETREPGKGRHTR